MHIRELVERDPLNAHWLGRHLAASLRTTAARLGAALAMIHVVLGALFRAPVADVRAQLAGLLGERTVAGHRVGA